MKRSLGLIIILGVLFSLQVWSCEPQTIENEIVHDAGLVKKREKKPEFSKEPVQEAKTNVETIAEKDQVFFCDNGDVCPRYYRCQPIGLCGESCGNLKQCPSLLLDRCKTDRDCKTTYAKCIKHRCTIHRLCSRGYCSPQNCNNNQHCDQKKGCPRCVNHVCRYGKDGGCVSDKDCPEKTYCDDCGNCTPWCKTKQDCNELSSDTCTMQCLKGRCIETCKQLVYEPASSDAGITFD
jgi:hypothetical protein